jgi:GH15 family glucan-1,4-alpha-glucosidase
MPDEENKTVDIDSSGPEVDVDIETSAPEEEVSVQEEKETVTEVTSPSTLDASSEQQETTEDKTEEKKDELEVYSKDVQRRIAKLTKKWREAEREQDTIIPTMDNLDIPQQPTRNVPDEKAENWAAKNKWFGSDKAMTYTAFDLHKTLTDEEGYDPKSDEYYVEIDKRIRLEFPHKFDTNEGTAKTNTTRPTQQVASARRSVNSSRKTVRLTPTEVVIAKKLGVPLEEYAKQKKYMKEV